MSFNFIRNAVLKGLALFLVLNLVFTGIDPSMLGRLSLYNNLFTGRERFPFGEDSSRSYNLSLFNLEAMFASHVISNRQKPLDEFRVIIIGDSSTWGILLHPKDTLAGQLNSAHLSICSKKLNAYNLGYPTISLMKDLMILDAALIYQPDLIIWPVTLEAFPVENQLSSPIVANNPVLVANLILKYVLPLDPNSSALVQTSLWNSTLIGQRRQLADLFRLQIYGILWAATGIDQEYSTDYQRAQVDFNSDISFHQMTPESMDNSKLAYGLLDAGLSIAGDIPILLINEPMLISSGENSDLRYNFLYPHWIYDQWRENMQARTGSGKWDYLDLWNIAPPEDFTNSAIHLTPAGESLLANRVKQTILQVSCP
jgi:hypothetical protein